MECHVIPAGPLPAPAALERALRAADPAAVHDVSPDGRQLRVSSTLDEHELCRLLGHLGCAVTARDIVRQPSTCCGGCSG